MTKKTLLLLTVLFAGVLTPASAAPILVKKITAPINPATGLPYINGFGYAMALSPKWMAFGVAGDSNNRGCVFVHNASTGAFVRKLIAPDAVDGDRLGFQVAISGDMIIASAPYAKVGSSIEAGKVYVFSATTGKQVRAPLTLPVVNAEDRFGYSGLEADGDLLVTGDSLFNSNQGRAWTVRISSGLVTLLVPDDAAINASNRFGFSFDISGPLVAVGAPGHDDPNQAGITPGHGAVYLFDRETGAHIKTMLPRDTQTGVGDFGSAISLEGSRLLVGSPKAYTNEGDAYLMDIRNNQVMATFALSNPGANDTFGLAVELQGTLAVISASNAYGGYGRVLLYTTVNGDLIDELEPQDWNNNDTLGSAMALCGTNLILSKSGGNAVADQSVLLYQNLPEPLPGTVVATTGSYAQGIPGATYTGFTTAICDQDGAPAYIGSVKRGTGSPAGVTKGLWTGGDPALVIATGKMPGNPVTILDVFAPVMNTAAEGVVRVQASGTGYNPANSGMTLCGYNFTGGETIILSGTQQSVAAGALISSFKQYSQSFHGTHQEVAVLCQMKAGLGGITAAKDSVIILSPINAFAGAPIAQEGVGNNIDQLGQINRLTYNWDRVLYHAALPNPAANQAVYARHRTNSMPTMEMKHNQTFFLGVTEHTVKSIISENSSAEFDAFAFRTSLTTAAEPKPREHLLSKYLGLSSHAAVGVSTNFLTNPAITIDKFLGYWIEEQALMFQCKLKGPGINASNDVALVVSYFTGIPGDPLPHGQIVLREGDPAPGCGGARIGVIQRVDAEPRQGYYTVLASLVGAPAGQDLVLFSGATDKALSADSAAPPAKLRIPTPVLRKGSLINLGLEGSAKITSITISSTAVDAGGAGGRVAHSVGDRGVIIAIIGLSDGTKRVVQVAMKAFTV